MKNYLGRPAAMKMAWRIIFNRPTCTNTRNMPVFYQKLNVKIYCYSSTAHTSIISVQSHLKVNQIIEEVKIASVSRSGFSSK